LYQIVYKTKSQKNYSNLQFSVLDNKIWFSLVAASFLLAASFSLNAYGQAGHDLPPSNIGDRQVFLSFNAPSIADPSESIAMSYSFMDRATGKNVQHVTYFLSISNPQGKQIFSEALHGHDGTVNVQFRPGEGQYKVNANYDNLAASYVADPGGAITIVGPVFIEQGSYKVNIEVNGIDYDNTFLPEPITYEYPLIVAPAQKFAVSYEEMNFNVSVSSPSQVENIELKPENKQLIIQYPRGEWQQFDDFQVYVDIPKEMMAGPFTAVFNGMDLIVSEEDKDDRTTTLILNVMQMNQSGGMEGMEQAQQQNAIIVTATSVVPEFPFALLVAGAAISAALAVTRKIRTYMI